MPIAGLIVADGELGAAMPSLLPVAGQPLIELQARVAHSLGAAHIVVLVDAIPPALVASFDRLRRDGIALDLARSAADAADRIHPDETLIVMAGGVIAPRAVLSEATDGAAVIAAVADTPATAQLERIDATRRWTGLAVIDGALLRSTAKMLGDWTLGPTLLRMALQAKIEVRELPGSLMVGDAEAAATASRALAMGDEASGGFVARWLIAPLVSVASPWLYKRHVAVGTVAAMPSVLLLASLLAALTGLAELGLALVLLAGVPRMIAQRLSRMSGRKQQWLDWAGRLALPALAASAFALAWRDYQAGADWGLLALAGWLIVALALQPRVDHRATWLADAETSALVLLIAALAGHPFTGLAIALAHAVTSQAVMVRQLN